MTLSLLPAVFAAVGCLSPDGGQSVRIDPMRTEEIRVESAGGPIAATAGEAAADLLFASGRTEPGYVVAVYEPKTRLLWWRHELRNPTVTTGPIARLRETTRFYLVDAKLVSFAVNGRFLSIRESTERAGSLQDGLNGALASLKASLAEIESGTKEWFTRVDLGSLGHEFFLRAGAAATLDPPAITGVSFGGGRWTVTLQGPNRDTAIVTLDDRYALVNIRREPAK